MTTTTTTKPVTTTTTTKPVTTTTTTKPVTTTTTTKPVTTTTTTNIFVGTTYYVSNTGNDALDGKSEINAWKTISKVNSSTFNAGDRILFKKGDTWREILTINRSGAAGSYMYFGNYGIGNLPRILASKTTTWTNQSGNIWKSDITFINPDSLAYYTRSTTNEHSSSGGSTDYEGSEIYFELSGGTKEWGHYRPNTTSLTGIYQWCWTSNYMYIYCTGNPNLLYTAVEIPQRKHIIDLNYKNYIQISGLALLYSGMDCISYSATNGSFGSNTGLIVEYCEIAYVSTKGSGYGYGIEAPYSTSIFRHNEFHDCGRRAISFHLADSSGIAVTNVLIEDNYFHDGWHTTGPDFNVGNGTASLNGVIVRRNKFYDPTTAIQDPYGWDWSEHMFFQNYNYSSSPSQLQNFYIYSNIFISPKGNSLNIESGKNINVWNNTFYNHNDNNTGRAHVWIDTQIISVNIKNNIFYTIKSNDAGGGELFLRNGANLGGITSNGNLYYRINTSTRIVEDEGTMYHMNDIALIRSNLGYELNSPTPSNPNFVNAPTDFNVPFGSPAIAAGIQIVDINFDGLDYDGNAYANPPTIGAFEY